MKSVKVYKNLDLETPFYIAAYGDGETTELRIKLKRRPTFTWNLALRGFIYLFEIAHRKIFPFFF